MSEQKKSFMREVIDALETAGFEVTSFEGSDYQVVCDWAKVTVRRLPPDMPEDMSDLRTEPRLRLGH
jgi:predicted RNA binding protein YcfA (HicA-like mRNA interferase family)